MIDFHEPEIMARFWGRVQPSTDDRCWPWMGDTSGKLKYGRMRIRRGGGDAKRVGVRANRLSFFYANGFWPHLACHSCDNPRCCNPKHIFDGTPKDNMDDMVRKGRKKVCPGESHGMSKLTEDQVRAIRTRYSEGGITHKKLSEIYGVTCSMITMIINRKSWSHI